MSVYKRSNSSVWYVDIRTPNGDRIRESTGTADRQLAEEYHDRLKTRYWEAQRLGVKPERSWQEAALRWIKETEYKADHKNDVAKLRWLDKYLGHLTLNQISRDVIDKVAAVKKKEATESTANHYLALVRAILRRAKYDWEWIDRIPKVRLFQVSQKRVRWLTHEEARRLLFELPTHLCDMAAFTLATGLRQSNVSYLRWDQVDMQRQSAWIHADQAKARRAIPVPLNEDALSVLRRRKGKHHEWVFTYNDAPVARCSTKAWYAALERAGIEDFRWHDLRHTWASWHVQAGTGTYELMELGSWSSVEMVQRYAHLDSSHLLEAASRIDGTKLTHPRLVSGL